MRLAFLVALATLVAGCAAPSDVGTASVASDALAFSDCLSDLGGLDLQRATIADLQAALAEGRITSVELVDAYLARIGAFDTQTNSVQAIDPTARDQAAAMDAERAAGRVRGPMHGIPVLLKDNIGTATQPNTAGSIALAENRPAEDAFLAAKLRESGAILLGKVKLSEFAHWVSLNSPSGYSSLGGQVVNAYNGGDPSGSSSGSGVAASMAFASIAIGTETSGSILSPSNENSLVGLKPTTGLVSRSGIIPLAASFDTAGPMGRHVRDVAITLAAIAGTDPDDPRTAEADANVADYVGALSPDALQGARLGYASSNERLAPAIKELEALGATLVEIDTNGAEDVSLLEIPLIFNEFKAGINAYLANEASDGLPVSNLRDIILYNQEHPEKFPDGQDLLILSEAQPGISLLTDVAGILVIDANRRVADRLFAQNDLDAIVGANAPFTGLGAAAGYPTMVVPLGYAEETPYGLSFFGPMWSEAKLLSYAYAYEQGTMHRLPPTAVNTTLLEAGC